MSFSLYQGVDLEFSPCNDAAPASIICDSGGMGIASQGFVDCASATIDTVGSQHFFWETSDYLRFNQITLMLESYFVALPDFTAASISEELEAEDKIYRPRLLRPCLPFSIPSPSPTLRLSGDTLYSLYDSCAEVKSARRIAPNLAMMFDVHGQICGWRMTRYLDQFRFDGKEVESIAEKAEYSLFDLYFNTFTSARFDAEDKEIADSCVEFLSVIEQQYDGLRASALATWVRDIADRFRV